MHKIKEIKSDHADIVAVIYQDEDCESPDNDIVKIAYRGRETLGNQHCTIDELDDIKRGIPAGRLIGVPVYAYVHSGSTISTGRKLPDGTVLRQNPFHCPWDSGQSGFAYMTAEDALKEWGNKRLSTKQKAKAIAYIDGVVDEFAMYLRGEVYGYVIEQIERDADGKGVAVGVTLDSCWGCYGLECATEEALTSLRLALESQAAPV